MVPEKHQNLGIIFEYQFTVINKYFYMKIMNTFYNYSDEDLSCVINFVFSYYFLIAAFIWFFIFTYTLYAKFQSFGMF